jgi:hypothetical protein
VSRLKTLIKTTAMTFTAAAVLATSAGLAANAEPPMLKGDPLEEVGQGYHLQIDDNLVWFGGLKNPDGHDPLIWSTIFTNKIPYNSQGYFLNTTNVDNHQDPQLSVTGTQMGWILATYESVNTAQSRAAISLLNRLNFDASAYALDYSARQVGRNAQLKSRPAASSRTNAWVVLGAQLLSTAVTPKHSQMNYALMIVATLELVQVLADLYRQAQQVNTANMILRDTRAVYDRLRDETPSVATSSFAQLEAHHVPLQQDTLPEPDQADQEVTTEQVTAEPVLVGAGIEPQREETYEQQLRKRHKFLNTSAHPLFDSPEARQRRKQEKESRQGEPPLPGLGVPPVLRKAKNPTTPNHVPKQDRSRGHGRSL